MSEPTALDPVRLICGVEFVFPDYKEPLVQLQGAVEGYMRGTLPYALSDGRLPCAFCDPRGKRRQTRRGLRRLAPNDSLWHVLAPHLRKVHGMTPQEYRDRIGLLRKTRLVSAPHRARAVAAISAERREWFGHLSDRGRSAGPGIENRGAPEALNKRGVCRDQLLAVTKRIAKDNGGRVRKADLERQGVWGGSIRRFFPSMCALCTEAGVAYAGKPDWTDAEMLRAFRELAIRLGRTPTQKELRGANGTPSSSQYHARFGGLEEVCRRIGLPSNSPHPILFGDEIDILNRYAQTGSVKAVALATHHWMPSISQVLAKYGATPSLFPAERRKAQAWAAEVAQRLAS